MTWCSSCCFINIQLFKSYIKGHHPTCISQYINEPQCLFFPIQPWSEWSGSYILVPIVMRGQDFLTCLCVPEFDVPVVPTAEELLPRIVKGDVPHCLLMTTVGTYAPPLIVYFPDLEKLKDLWNKTSGNES